MSDTYGCIMDCKWVVRCLSWLALYVLVLGKLPLHPYGHTMPYGLLKSLESLKYRLTLLPRACYAPSLPFNNHNNRLNTILPLNHQINMLNECEHHKNTYILMHFLLRLDLTVFEMCQTKSESPSNGL